MLPYRCYRYSWRLFDPLVSRGSHRNLDRNTPCYIPCRQERMSVAEDTRGVRMVAPGVLRRTASFLGPTHYLLCVKTSGEPAKLPQCLEYSTGRRPTLLPGVLARSTRSTENSVPLTAASCRSCHNFCCLACRDRTCLFSLLNPRQRFSPSTLASFFLHPAKTKPQKTHKLKGK